MTPTAPTDSQIELPLPRQQKELIEQAAALCGQSLRDFASETLIEKAREVLESGSSRVLSERDARRFLDLLDADIAPNDALRKAAVGYKERHA